MKLLLLGATGAVGCEVLSQALIDERIEQIIAPTRRSLADHPKLQNPITDLKLLDQSADYWQVDAVICTLGTTIKQAGSKAEFTRIDHDLPLQIATLAKAKGARAFALNSSLGAKIGKNFYLTTKAEAEQDIGQLGYESFTIVRPSLINTQRQPVRRGEQLGLCFAALFKPLIPNRYRPVTPTAIAHTLLDAVISGRQGVNIIESENIN